MLPMHTPAPVILAVMPAAGIFAGRYSAEPRRESATGKVIINAAESLKGAGERGYGYGYLFRLNSFGCYRNDGVGGRYPIIVPEHGLTIAALGETEDLAPFLKVTERMEKEPGRPD